MTFSELNDKHMPGLIAPLVVVVTAAGLVVSTRPRVRGSPTWRATVTPLASIIGSGFLVVAPLLAATVGSWAPIAMTGITVSAYLVGAIVRFNILHLEPALDDGSAPHVLLSLERLSELALGFAYVISVAFYLRLLASFVLGGFDGDLEFEARLVATVLLTGIGIVGSSRGLGGLEILEETAVAVKLSIILGLFAGIIYFDAAHWSETITAYENGAEVAAGGWTTIRSLAGMLLVVQGFETSRYLGATYDAATRIRTMRYAQIASGAIYVLFITLVVPLFDTFSTEIDDTAILDAAGEVTMLLVPLVVIAAAASQLSAGVADTAGGGGMLLSRSPHHQKLRAGYVAVVLGAVALLWAADVFAIIALASRAFAVYYFIQASLAFVCAGRVATGRTLLWKRAGIAVVGAGLAFVAAAGIPAT